MAGSLGSALYSATMHHILRTALLVTSVCACWAQSNRGYYRYPAIHGDQVVFTSEGDLWEVVIAGGAALDVPPWRRGACRLSLVFSKKAAWQQVRGRERYTGTRRREKSRTTDDSAPSRWPAGMRSWSLYMPISARPRPVNYEGRGTANVFCAVEPKAGRHFTYPTPDLSAFQFARVACDLAPQYPDAETIQLAMDNLNILIIAATR